MTPAPVDHASSAIHQLLAIYCHVLDARAWHRLPEIFTPDATYDASSLGLGVHHGIPAITAFWEKATHPLAHHVSAIVLTPDCANLRIASKGFFAWPDGMSGGDYHDVAVPVASGWRLRHRSYTRRWSTRQADGARG